MKRTEAILKISLDVLNGPSDKVSTAVIDSTSVNAKNVGEYEIKVTCDGNTYTVTVSVKILKTCN